MQKYIKICYRVYIHDALYIQKKNIIFVSSFLTIYEFYYIVYVRLFHLFISLQNRIKKHVVNE